MTSPLRIAPLNDTAFDPYSETLSLATNQNDTSLNLAAMPVACEEFSKPESQDGLRRVVVTPYDELWFSSRATQLDRELHKLLTLNHPGIVRIQSVVRTKTGWLIDFDAPAIASTLAEEIQRRTRPWREAAEFVAKLADIVAAVHACGVRHGAICPEVILLTASGQPLIADFGLGLFGPNCQMERSLAKAPGPCAAPEQILSWPIPVDLRSDVYALGVILYHLLCSRYPFRAADPRELQRAIVDDAPQPPRQLAHGLPQVIEQLCLRLLEKNPSQRPANSEELARELRRLLDETETIEPAAGMTAVRKTATVSTSTAMLMIVSLELLPESSTKDATCDEVLTDFREAVIDDVARQGGVVQSQTEWEIIAQLPPADDADNAVTSTMSSFLRQALTLVSELRLGDHAIGFVIDSAESESLKHRATRLSGRVSAQGVEVTRATSELLSRWLPCRVAEESAPSNDLPSGKPGNHFAATPIPSGSISVLQQLATGNHGNGALMEVYLTGDRWLPMRIRPRETSDSAPPMVGRASQFAMLNARWDQAREGMGQFVLLIGDEGVGKSRLIQELNAVIAAGDEESQWIRWSCRPGSSNKRNDPAAPRHEQWQQETLDWLKQLAATSPVVFVVEDLQWIDPSALAFLHWLIDQGLNERVLTILTFRPEFETPWGSRAHQTQIALSRLTRRHAASMFSAITGAAEPTAALLDQLIATTEGIPLFVEGFARAWLRSEAPIV